MPMLNSRFTSLLMLTLPVVLISEAATASTQQGAADVLSAEASDPNRLGWMQGFPPAPEQVIGQPDSNYFSFRDCSPPYRARFPTS
ncbi:hypothetical protein [Vreelandella venusta]|uniref:hypothetical protein n=1 Tax=Vreelandella venusta TaxID=44935 RepID=UPI003C2DC6A2